RSKRDWSSDVCSSDLARPPVWAERAIPECGALGGVAAEPGDQILGHVREADDRAGQQAQLGEILEVMDGDDFFQLKKLADRRERSEERRVGKEWRCGG